MPSSRVPDILVVEDDPGISGVEAEILTLDGYTVRVAGTGVAAQEAITAHLPDLLILDYLLPDMDGLAFMRWLHQQYRPVPLVIMVTALRGAMDAGARMNVDMVLPKPDLEITKPFGVDVFSQAVATVLARRGK